MDKRLDPIEDTSEVIEEVAPLAMEMMRITEAIPITIPNIAKIVLSLLLRSDENEILNASKKAHISKF